MIGRFLRLIHNQKERATILFELYPDIEKAYKLSEKLKQLYNLKITKEIAMTKLAHWYKDVDESGMDILILSKIRFK